MNRPLETIDKGRRGFLRGMAGILAAGVAPAVIGSEILMPVRKLWTPPQSYVFYDGRIWMPSPQQFVVGVDPANGYDYGATVTMQWDDKTCVLRLVDWK